MRPLPSRPSNPVAHLPPSGAFAPRHRLPAMWLPPTPNRQLIISPDLITLLLRAFSFPPRRTQHRGSRLGKYGSDTYEDCESLRRDGPYFRLAAEFQPFPQPQIICFPLCQCGHALGFIVRGVNF